MNLWVNFDLKFDPILQGKMAKIVQNHLLCAFFANLKLTRLRRFIRKVVATKILLSGKFSHFVTLVKLSEHNLFDI